MATRWDYKVFELAAPSHQEMDDLLNQHGKVGYQIIHLKERENGAYFFILGRDTSRPIDEEEGGQKDWLVDVVTTPESELSHS